MKKMLLTIAFLSSTLFAAGHMQTKTGFLTTQSCAKSGTFVDCSLDQYKQDDLVLFVHDEGKYYKVKAANVNVIASLDQAFSRNEITLHSKKTVHKDTLEVDSVTMAAVTKAPPFKGCM